MKTIYMAPNQHINRGTLPPHTGLTKYTQNKHNKTKARFGRLL